MNYKVISVIGALILAVAVWFFYKEDTKIEPAAPIAPQVSYEVSEIKAVQTNEETGETEYTVTAKSLVQNAAGIDEMREASIEWQPPQGERFELSASIATLDQDSGEMALSKGFRLVRKATADKAEMVIEGASLNGNTKSRTVQSAEPLTVIQGTDKFKAASFRANLQTGEYEFDKIEVLFNAPKRTDKPLF